VDYPEKVFVMVREEEKRVVYTLFIDSADAGKLMGKHGRIVKAIRTVLFAADNSSIKKKVYLKLQNKGGKTSLFV
jgi:predicted RNA-binding protein YlqC (UPF0109 family)